MTGLSEFSHCTTALINVAAPTAFDFLSDPLLLGTWSLGCMRTQASVPTGPYVGISLYDDSRVWFNIRSHPDALTIDYLVGEPEDLKPRISARVVEGGTCGLGRAQCYVSLTAWRPVSMPSERWIQLCTAHEAEIWLIKARLENERAGAPSMS